MLNDLQRNLGDKQYYDQIFNIHFIRRLCNLTMFSIQKWNNVKFLQLKIKFHISFIDAYLYTSS